MDSSQARILIESVMNSSVGGWLINGSFGNGKSAVVLSAVKDGVEAAIKIFHPELIERYGKHVQLERISREKQLIGATHPNLVKILDGGECAETGHLFVVMERVPYKNLHDARGTIPPTKFGKLISQIASAARFLEDLGLAHRDIKPENIAVADDFERAILLDLGVLRVLKWSERRDTVPDKLFSKLCRLAAYIEELDDGCTDLLKAVAPFAGRDFNLSELVGELIRLAPSDPVRAASITEAMLSRSRPYYDSRGELKELLQLLVDHGQLDIVIPIVDKLSVGDRSMLDFYASIVSG